jgi:hypothetical protein
MLSYLRKSLTWIITSTVALAVGVGTLLLNIPVAANTTSTSNWRSSVWPPQWPHHGPPPPVPEVNTGWVLVPIVFAILLFTSRHLLRRRSLESR